MKAQLIRNDKEPVDMMPKNGTDFGLFELYELLECEMVQVIPLPDGRIMIMDEEGKSNHNANLAATTLAGPHLMPGDWIAGHVVVCPPDMFR